MLSKDNSDFGYMHIPTYAKKRQYMPANMGSGIDANRAPNFPGLPDEKHMAGKFRYTYTMTIV